MKNKQKFKKIQADRVTSIKFGEIIQNFHRNAKITNIHKFDALKTATNAKVSQAEKRIPVKHSFKHSNIFLIISVILNSLVWFP